MTEADPTKGGGLAAFGRYLVQERELRGLSREDVARATRLTTSAIEAIESGDPSRTHRAYVVVYLRGYAAAVGLDADDVVLRFEEALGPPSPAQPERSGRAARLALAAGAAALLTALAWWWSRRH